jgi:hypothetical protein
MSTTTATTALDFFASNEAQQHQATFQDKRFSRPIQWLKFAPDAKGQRIDILPMSENRTHAIIKQHRLPGSTMLCPTMFGKPCPLCDATAINRNDDWYWKNFKTQDRALFNAIPLNQEGKPMVMDKEHKIPVYLYEVSAPQKKAQGLWLLLTGALGSSDPEDAFKKQFFSWDKGCTLKLTFVKDSYEGKDYAKVSNLEFVHPRFDYSKERARYEPHLYKIPDIYQEPDLDELNRYLEMMVRQRSGGGYSAQLAGNSGGFYAQGQSPAPGTAAWAAAEDTSEVPF